MKNYDYPSLEDIKKSFKDKNQSTKPKQSRRKEILKEVNMRLQNIFKTEPN